MSEEFTADPETADALTIFATTIYAEARDQPEEGQVWVAWVIKNRADSGRSYWLNTIRGVCLQPMQFECWNNGPIRVNEPAAYKTALRIAESVMSSAHDPTGGCDHYNNPSKENASWVNGVKTVRRIKDHVFYKSY